jgi:protein-disulfide isomerase
LIFQKVFKGLNVEQFIMAENKETEKKDTIEIPIGKYINYMKRNTWMLVSAVLLIVLILVLIFKGGAGNAVSGTTAGNNLISFIKSQGQDAQLVSVVKGDSFYSVTFGINGSTQTVPVTFDGKYALPSVVPLTSTSTTNNQQQQSAATLKISDLNLSNYLSIGNKSAKVTVVEFSDFSCPYCEAASGDNVNMVAAMKQNDATWEPIVNNLMKDYVNTGKVRFVYIYSMGHTGGHSASSVGWCLNDQSSDKFWKYYPLVFASASADTENITLMEGLAKSVGADMTKLQSCLDSNKYANRFASEQNIAQQAGTQGTPAFFVNDEYVAHGAESYVQFKQAVDAALAQ